MSAEIPRQILLGNENDRAMFFLERLTKQYFQLG